MTDTQVAGANSMTLHKHRFNVFPEASEEDFNRIVLDMQNNGYDETQPIVLYQNDIIDGWNRYRASQSAGVSPAIRHFAGNDSEAIAFMLRTNKRRNLSSGQWATVAVEAEDILAAIAEQTERERREKISESRQPETTQKFVESRSNRSEQEAAHKAAELFNTNRTYIKQAETLKNESPDLYQQVKTGEVSISSAYKDYTNEKKKTERRERLEQQVASNPERTAAGEYELVLADPPWQYDFAQSDSRNLDNQYPTTGVEDIISHKPETADNCVLFLWATVAKLPEALQVMAGWGFSYKSSAVWDKQIIGMGYWFRGQHELLLVGTKGKISPPEPEFRTSSLFSEKRGPHSAKPECVYQWIENSFPHLAKLEMYCRNPRDGWAAWGNEAEAA